MKLWGGRFKEKIHPKVEQFSKSIYFDIRLAFADILVNKAQAKALSKSGLITEDESNKLRGALDEIQNQIENGSFKIEDGDEDIHSAIERSLTADLGDLGAKIHAGRSRNDQVNTDLRIYIKEECLETLDLIKGLQGSLLKKAEEHLDALIPGYTHLQRAQPLLLSHHLMAYFWMFERDITRIVDCFNRLDVLPLGSAALAGTTLEIDQETLRKELDFADITDNSLDSVSDRDFVVEFLSALAIIQTHLSRLAEEIILWTSAEFSYATLPDSLATGSSMMPQKKNPDVAELIRGKSGRVFGNLMAMLTTLKALPLSYNRDLQEDKEGLFDSIDTVQDCLDMMSLMIDGIRFNEEKMLQASNDWPLFATDLMEFLVSQGEPIRYAHKTIGNIVGFCLENNRALQDLTAEELLSFSEKFTPDVLKLCDPTYSVNSKKSIGSTSRSSVLLQLKKANNLLKSE